MFICKAQQYIYVHYRFPTNQVTIYLKRKTEENIFGKKIKKIFKITFIRPGMLFQYMLTRVHVYLLKLFV